MDKLTKRLNFFGANLLAAAFIVVSALLFQVINGFLSIDGGENFLHSIKYYNWTINLTLLLAGIELYIAYWLFWHRMSMEQNSTLPGKSNRLFWGLFPLLGYFYLNMQSITLAQKNSSTAAKLIQCFLLFLLPIKLLCSLIIIPCTNAACSINIRALASLSPDVQNQGFDFFSEQFLDSEFFAFVSSPTVAIADSALNLIFFPLLGVILWRIPPLAAGIEYSQRLKKYRNIMVVYFSFGLIFSVWCVNQLGSDIRKNEMLLQQKNIPLNLSELQKSYAAQGPVSPELNKIIRDENPLSDLYQVVDNDADTICASPEEQKKYQLLFMKFKISLDAAEDILMNNPPRFAQDFNSSRIAPGLILPNFNTVRALARVNHLRMRLDAANNQPKKVLKNFYQNMRLAEICYNHNTIISGLVANAVIGITCDDFGLILAQVQFSTEELQQLEKYLADFTLQMPEKIKYLYSSDYAIFEVFADCIRGKFSMQELYYDQPVKTPAQPKLPLAIYALYDLDNYFFWANGCNSLLQANLAQVEMFKNPDLALHDYPEYCREKLQKSPVFQHKLVKLMLDQMPNPLEIFLKYQTKLNLIRLACKIEIFKQKNGRLPADLNELNWQNMPLDIAQKQPFQYDIGEFDFKSNAYNYKAPAKKMKGYRLKSRDVIRLFPDWRQKKNFNKNLDFIVGLPAKSTNNPPEQ